MGIVSKVKETYQIVNMVDSKFGKALMEKAMEEHKNALQKEVVDFVRLLLVKVEQQTTYKANVEANLKLLHEKLQGIEAGQFELSQQGKITFKDPDLEKGEVTLTECKNCGFPNRR